MADNTDLQRLLDRIQKEYVYDPRQGYVKEDEVKIVPEQDSIIEDKVEIKGGLTTLPPVQSRVSSKIEENIREEDKNKYQPTQFYSKKYSANNPGNVQRLKTERRAGELDTGYGEKENPNRFPKFDHPVMGLRAIFMDMNAKIGRHQGDLKKMIKEYAPSSENKSKKYYNFVKKELGKGKVEKKDVRELVKAIVKMENKNIDDGKLVNWYLSPNNGFMEEAEKLSVYDYINNPSYAAIKQGKAKIRDIQVAERKLGGRIASNPNPYEPRVI